MFGGTTISLILPKLIRSVTRDGILIFLSRAATAPHRQLLFNDTRQARRVQRQTRHNHNRRYCFRIQQDYFPQWRERGGGTTPPPQSDSLLDFHFRASFFELFLGVVGVRLVRAFEHRFWRAFNQGLRLGQAQAGLYFAHGLDGCDFLVRRNGNENHIKCVFRGGGRSRASSGSRAGGRNRDGRGGGNAPICFKFFDELRDFYYRCIAQLLFCCWDVQCHIIFLSFVSSFTAATANFSSQPANRRFTLLLFVFCSSLSQSKRVGNF